MNTNDFAPAGIYDTILTEISNLLSCVENGGNNSSEIMKYTKDAEKKLRVLQVALQGEVNQLKQNSEWQVFTVAFYGETNAGKSTLIEILRILLHEQGKVKERSKYSEINRQINNMQALIDQLNAKKTYIIKQNSDWLGSYKKEMDIIQGDYERSIVQYWQHNLMKKQLNYEISKKISKNLIQFIQSLFGGLTEQKTLKNFPHKINEDEKKLLDLVSKIRILNEEILAAQTQIDQTDLTITGKVNHERKKKARFVEQLTNYADGRIIGDGRSDYTQTVNTYNFKIANTKIALLDLPGIEGREQNVQDEINNAIEKAHVVFYVSGKPTPPQKGGNNQDGTIEKIQKQLRSQTEIYFIYNKRIRNPCQLSNPLVNSKDEENSLKTVDSVMRDVFFDQYVKSISLSAYPAFISRAKCLVDSSFKKEKEKFIHIFDSEDKILKLSKVDEFSKWLTTELIDGVTVKIKNSNLNKIHVSIKNTKTELEKIVDDFSELQDQVDNGFKATKVSINKCKETFKSQLTKILKNNIDVFKSSLGTAIYQDIDKHLNNDEFKDKLNKRIEEGKTELIKKTNEEIQSANADFQIEISNIIHNYENHVNALIATYSESVDFEYSFNPEINIRNTFSIKKLGGEILALFLGIFSGNAAGWLLVATSVITFIIDAGKNIMGIFDQKYRAAEQRKSADENINKLAASLEGILSKNVKKPGMSTQVQQPWSQAVS